MTPDLTGAKLIEAMRALALLQRRVAFAEAISEYTHLLTLGANELESCSGNGALEHDLTQEIKNILAAREVEVQAFHAELTRVETERSRLLVEIDQLKKEMGHLRSELATAHAEIDGFEALIRDAHFAHGHSSNAPLTLPSGDLPAGLWLMPDEPMTEQAAVKLMAEVGIGDFQPRSGTVQGLDSPEPTGGAPRRLSGAVRGTWEYEIDEARSRLLEEQERLRDEHLRQQAEIVAKIHQLEALGSGG